jgi:hypothetical protein
MRLLAISIVIFSGAVLAGLGAVANVLAKGGADKTESTSIGVLLCLLGCVGFILEWLPLRSWWDAIPVAPETKEETLETGQERG